MITFAENLLLIILFERLHVYLLYVYQVSTSKLTTNGHITRAIISTKIPSVAMVLKPRPYLNFPSFPTDTS